MRHVDHDPDATRLAATRCRDVADHYVRVATWLEGEPRRVRWWGGERDAVVGAAAEVAGALRREAAALRDSAERLDLAVRAALQREADLAAAAAATARRTHPEPLVLDLRPSPPPAPPPADLVGRLR